MGILSTVSEDTQEAKKSDFDQYPKLLTPNQAAELSNVSAFTIRKLCREGKLKALQIGSVWRINRDALIHYLGLD